MKQKRKIILSGFLLILILGLGVYYLTMDNNAGPDNAADWICTAGINGITVISIWDKLTPTEQGQLKNAASFIEATSLYTFLY